MFRWPIAFLRLAGLFLVVVVLLPFALCTRLVNLLGAGGRERALRGGAAMQRLWARASLPLFGVRVRTPGPAPEGVFLIAANHSSYLDVVVLASLFPARFVAMHEIARWPLMGWMSRSVGTLFVNRERKRDVLEVGPRMDATLQAGVSVVLFPEGGASSGVELRPFRTPLFEGAARCGIPCLPVTLHYRTPGHPVAPVWTTNWWGGMGLARHLLRLLGLGWGRPVEAEVRWAPTPQRGSERKALAEAVRREMARSFRPYPWRPLPPDLPWPELAQALAGEAGGGSPAGDSRPESATPL